MTRYLITAMVTQVYGSQTFAVDADSEEAARTKFLKSGGDFVEESIEVQGLDLGNIDIEEEAP